MGKLQELWAELNPYFDIEQQQWYIEARQGAYDAVRDGNYIKFHFLDIEQMHDLEKTATYKKLLERNISCNVGYDYLCFISVSYDFKNRRPRRNNSRKELILD